MVGTLSKDPVCGEDVSVNKAEKAGRKSSYLGKTYYFSSDECKGRFDKNPVKYAEKSAEEDPSRDRGASPKTLESEGKKR